jgi:D-alanine-D-alanine ligase-like ATP-grasp enzyme
MFRLCTNPALLGGLYAMAMARAFARYRNPRRRAIGRHHVAFYDRMWREAAAELGGTCRSLGGDILEIELDGQRTRVVENSSAIDDPVTIAVLADKALTHRILGEHGLPVPMHAVFSLQDVDPAVEFLGRAGGDCVVKPAAGTGGGRGVTTGVRSRWQLARAAAGAAVYCDQLLIERQVSGENYRLLYLDGELVDAFVRRPPAVVGDGRSSVAALIRAANRQRLGRGAGLSQTLLTVDLEVRRTLARQGLSLRSVPDAGERVVVKTVVNENCGEENVPAGHVLCPAIVEAGARSVRALGARLAGVDVITSDPAVPLSEAGGVILEVNAPPNYYYHYCQSGGGRAVAVHVLKRLLAGDRSGSEVGVAHLV